MRLFDVLGRRALIGYESARAGVAGLLRGQEREQDLSYLDGTCATDLSPSGDRLLFVEAWEGGGAGYSVYLRDATGDLPVHLGPGWGSALSSDGRLALSYPVDPPMKLVLTPTGTGAGRVIDLPRFEAIGGASWLPAERGILFWASEAGESFRGYVIDLPDGEPRPVTPAGVTPGLFTQATHALSPDGRTVAVNDLDGRIVLYPLDGGEPRPVPGVLDGEVPVARTGDGRSLLVRNPSEVPNRVFLIDLGTGKRTFWKELMPPDPAGVLGIPGVVATPDHEHYAYTYIRMLTELYVVDGLE